MSENSENQKVRDAAGDVLEEVAEVALEGIVDLASAAGDAAASVGNKACEVGSSALECVGDAASVAASVAGDVASVAEGGGQVAVAILEGIAGGLG